MKIEHGNPESNLKPRKQRVSKHSALIEACFQMEPGDFVDHPILAGRSMEKERNAIRRVLDRYVRQHVPEHLFKTRLTARRQVRVSCHHRKSSRSETADWAID